MLGAARRDVYGRRRGQEGAAAKFWARHREAVLAAEAALEEHSGDLSKVTKVGDLKALIISRTWRTAKAAGGRDALRVDGGGRGGAARVGHHAHARRGCGCRAVRDCCR